MKLAAFFILLALGAPAAERLVARGTFERVARRGEVATEDGSAGFVGYVTGLAKTLVAAGCGDQSRRMAWRMPSRREE